MFRKGSMVAAIALLVLGALTLRPPASAADDCTWEAWGHVSGGHYDCLGSPCAFEPNTVCCKICPTLPGEG